MFANPIFYNIWFLNTHHLLLVGPRKEFLQLREVLDQANEMHCV